MTKLSWLNQMYFTDPTNYSYLIGGIFALAVSILIISKDPKVIFNILFSVSLFLWSISLLANAFTFLFVEPNQAAQIVRDISTSSGVIASFFVFASAFSIYYGFHYLKKSYILLPSIFISVTSAIISILFDEVVFDTETGIGVKTTQKPWVLIFLYLIPAIMIIMAEIYFMITRKQTSDPTIKTRIFYFVLGFGLILGGILVYIIFALIEQLIGLESFIIEYVSWIIASVLWALGPILMVVGFYLGRTKNKGKSETIVEAQ